MQSRYLIVACSAVCLLFGEDVARQSLAVTYSASTPNGGSFTSNNGSSVSSSYHSPLVTMPGGVTGSLDETAAAGISGLRASAQAHISGSFNGLPSSVIGGSGTASGSWNDFVLIGPAAGSIPISLNLQLDGTFSTGAILSNNWANSGRADMNVTVNGSFAGQSFAGGYSQAKEGYPPPGGPISSSSTGVFGTAGSLPVNFTSPTFMVTVGAPFDVTLQLIAGASAFYAVGASSGPGPHTMDLLAISDFSSTLTFDRSGPVFNVPAGYTVNSVSAGVIDNRFIVPDPTTLAMLLAALPVAYLGYWRRRK